jgi:Mg2+/Co2+ transporter CorC
VSEEELRLIVMGAKQSGGIEKQEAKMVEGVLDLQDMRVSEVMKPRIKVVALEANSTLADFLQVTLRGVGRLVGTTHAKQGRPLLRKKASSEESFVAAVRGAMVVTEAVVALEGGGDDFINACFVFFPFLEIVKAGEQDQIQPFPGV